MWERMLESCWVVFSLTERTEFTELLAHVSSPQKASGIQSSQSVSAIVDAEQGATRSLHPAHRGISVITPLPAGEGLGGGATSSWVQNGAQRGSVKSVRSVREKPPHRVVCVLSHRVGAFYFSQKNTDEQNTQRPTETLSQPISQSVTAIFS